MQPQLSQIQAATLAARSRTGDKSISVRVKQGFFQAVRVTYNAKGKSTVAPASDWLPSAALIQTLNTVN